MIRRDIALVMGLLFLILTFLLLTTTPGALYCWLHRDGYRRVEAIVSPPAPPPFSTRSVTVQIVDTGERLTIPVTALEVPVQAGRRTLWLNPHARLYFLGILAFDERVITHPTAAARGWVPLVWTVAFAAMAIGLLRYGWRTPSSARSRAWAGRRQRRSRRK